MVDVRIRTMCAVLDCRAETRHLCVLVENPAVAAGAAVIRMPEIGRRAETLDRPQWIIPAKIPVLSRSVLDDARLPQPCSGCELLADMRMCDVQLVPQTHLDIGECTPAR